MKEVQLLDQQAKAHMEESFRLSLEEKDEKITVMHTQVRLLKERITDLDVDNTSSKAQDDELQQLKQKVTGLESSLVKYKGALKLTKEKIQQLQSEKTMMSEELRKQVEQIRTLESRDVNTQTAESQQSYDTTDASTGHLLESTPTTPTSPTPTATRHSETPETEPSSTEATLKAQLTSLGRKHETIVGQLRKQINSVQSKLDGSLKDSQLSKDEVTRMEALLSERDIQIDNLQQKNKSDLEQYKTEVLGVREQTNQIGIESREQVARLEEKLTLAKETVVKVEQENKIIKLSLEETDSLLREKEDKFKVELEKMAAENHQTLVSTRASFEKEVEDLKSKYVGEMERVASEARDVSQKELLQGKEQLKNTHEESLELFREELSTKHLTDLKQATDNHKKEAQALQDSYLSEIEALKASFTDETESLKAQLSQSELEHRTELSSYQSKMSGLETDKSSLISQLTQVRQEQQDVVSSLKAEMEGLMSGKDEQLSLVTTNLREQVQSSQDDYHQLQDKYRGIEGECSKLKTLHTSALESHQKEMAMIEKRGDKQREEDAKRNQALVEQLKQKVASLKGEATSVAATYQTGLASIEKELADKRLALENLSKDNRKALEEMERKSETEIKRVREDLKTAEEALASRLSERDSQINELQDILQRKTAELEQSQVDHRSLMDTKVQEVKTAHLSAVDELKNTHLLETDSLKKEFEKQLMSLKSSLEEEQLRASSLEDSSTSVQALMDRGREELERMRNKHSLTMAELESKHKESLAKLQEDLYAMKEHVSSLEQQHEAKVNSLVESHNDTMTRLNTEHTHALEMLKASEQTQLSETLRKKDEELRSFGSKYKEDTATMASQHSATLEKAQLAHQEEVDRFSSALQEKEAQLQFLKDGKEKMQHDQLAITETLQSSHRQEIDQLQSVIQQKAEQLNVLQTSHEEQLLGLTASHKELVHKLTQDHLDSMESRKTDHMEEIKRLVTSLEEEQVNHSHLKAVHEEKLKKFAGLKKAYQEKLQQLQQIQTAKIKSLEDKHRAELSSQLDIHLQEVVTKLKADFENTLEEEHKKFDLEMSRIESNWVEERDKLKSSLDIRTQQLEGKEAEIKETAERHKSEMEQREKDSLAKMEEALREAKELNESQITQLRQELDSAQKEVQADGEERVIRERAQREVADSGYKTQIQSLTQTNKSLQEKLEAVAKEHDTITTEMQLKVTSLESDLTEGKQNSEELVRTVKELQTKTKSLEDASNSKSAEVLDLASKLSACEADYESKRSEVKKRAEAKLAAIKKQFNAQLEAKGTELGTKITQLENVVEISRTSLEKLSNEKNQIQKQLESSSTENRSLHKQVLSLQEQVSKTDQEMVVLAQSTYDEIGTLKSTLRDKDNKITSHLAECQALSSQLVKSQEEHSVLEMKMKDVHEQVLSLEIELQEKKESLVSVSGEREIVVESLTKMSTEKASELENLESKHNGEIKRLKAELRQAKKLSSQAEKDWKSKLEEMLVTVNTEREKLVKDHLTQITEASDREDSLKHQLKELQSRYDHLKATGERTSTEKQQEKEKILARISQLEHQLSTSQDNFDRQIAKMTKETETKIEVMKEQLETQLTSKDSELDAQILQTQLELENKYTQEKAQLSAEGVSVSRQHEQVLRNVEERYSFELSDLKKKLNQTRSELQEAKDRLLGEEEKFSKFEKQLLNLQNSHQVELDAIKSQHEQEIFERTSKYSGAGLEAQSLQKQFEAEKTEFLERIKFLEEQSGKLASLQADVTRLESMVKQYKNSLRTNESQREQLQREKQRLVSQQLTDVSLTTPTHGMTTPTWGTTTPTRPMSPSVPDTPSKDLVLEEEPHGAEFEYFKNVLFEYMMGRQTQHLVKVIAALARFSERQQRQLEAKAQSFFTSP